MAFGFSASAIWQVPCCHTDDHIRVSDEGMLLTGALAYTTLSVAGAVVVSRQLPKVAKTVALFAVSIFLGTTASCLK